jgi:twitching motility protein PilJ
MLRRWKVWQKLALIALVMGLMIPVLLFLLVRRQNEQIDSVRRELVGTEALKPLRALFGALAQHRGRVDLALAGDASARGQVAGLQAQVDSELRRLELVERQAGGALGSAPALAALRGDWQRLKGQAHTLPAERAFAEHSALLARVLERIEDVGDSSTLRLDPVRESSYLAEEVLLWGPRSVAALAEARDVGTGALARERLGPGEDARLSALAASLQSFEGGSARATRIATANDPALKAELGAKAAGALAAMGAFVHLLEDPAARAASGGRGFFAAGTAAIEARDAASDAILSSLQRTLDRRAKGGIFARNVLLALTLVVVTPAVFLILYVSGLIARQVESIGGMFQRIARGDFKARARVFTQDELGAMAGSLNAVLNDLESLLQTREERDRTQASIMKLLDEISGLAEGDLTREAEVTSEITGAVADSFNYLCGQLRQIIGDVQATTERVTRSAAEIQAATESLAEGSEAQSLRIVDTSAAVEEIAASVQQVSDSSTSATGVAEQARRSAEKGAEAVVRTIDGMNGIRQQVQETAKRIKRLGESSQEVGEIVQLIGDIADRTSILALNASIQAAMAGEAGRGFAVVAEEVERLAVRSADATKKIGALIKTIQAETNDAVRAMEETTREVVSGSGLANAAGEALGEIEKVSQGLAELIGSISLASQQQARGSDSVAKAMGDISLTTRHTAAGAKQVAVSIRDLSGLAEELRSSVSAFKLPSRAA